MDDGRSWFRAAGAGFALFVADILIAKVQVLSGSVIPVHLGDTAQFLVLLVAVTLFVAGAVVREGREGTGEGRIASPGEDPPPSA